MLPENYLVDSQSSIISSSGIASRNNKATSLLRFIPSARLAHRSFSHHSHDIFLHIFTALLQV